MSSLIHGRVSPVYSGIRGVPGTHVFQRMWTLRVTGRADADQCTCEIVANRYNSELIGAENVDQTTPAGGTDFDIDATGVFITVKGMSHTAVACIAGQPHNDIAGALNFMAHAEVTAGKMVVNFMNSGTSAALDLTGVAVGEYIQVNIMYWTSD